MPKRPLKTDPIYNALLAAERAVESAKRNYRMNDPRMAREWADRAATAAGEAQSGLQTLINDARNLEEDDASSDGFLTRGSREEDEANA